MIWASCGAVTGTNLVTFLIGAIALRFVFLLPSELVPFFCGICDLCRSTHWCGVYVVFVFVWCLLPAVFVALLEFVRGVVCV